MSDLNTPQSDLAGSGSDLKDENPSASVEQARASEPLEFERPWGRVVVLLGSLACIGLLIWLGTTLLEDGKLVPVTGRVLWEGRPVTGGFVMSTRPGAALSAVSALDDDGRFDMMTNGVPGAATGKQQVVVQVFSRGMPPKPLVPSKYTDASTTPLSIAVSSSGTNYFELEIEGPRTDGSEAETEGTDPAEGSIPRSK